MIETGTFLRRSKLRAKFPAGLIALTRLPGLGPKRRAPAALRARHRLARGAARGCPRRAPAQPSRGLGPKFEASVLRLAERDERPADAPTQRIHPAQGASRLGEALVAGLERLAGPGTARELAGSARRRADSVKDLDIDRHHHAPHDAGQEPRQARADRAGHLGRQGGRPGAHPCRHRRRPANRQAGSARQPAAALHRLGRPQHRPARGRGAGAASTSPSTASSTTRRARPSVRNRGRGLRGASAWPTSSPSCARIAASSRRPRDRRSCPQLIELGDIRGDLHSHTIASDGHNTIEEMAPGGARARLRVPRDHRSLGEPRLRQRRLAGCSCAARSSSCAQAGERIEGIELLAGSRGQHPARRLARLRGRAAGASSTG